MRGWDHGTQIKQTESTEAAAESSAQEAENRRAESLAQIRQATAAERARLERLEQQRAGQREAQLRVEAELLSHQEKLKSYGVFLGKVCGGLANPEAGPGAGAFSEAAAATGVTPTGRFSVVDGHALVPLVLLLEGYRFNSSLHMECYAHGLRKASGNCFRPFVLHLLSGSFLSLEPKVGCSGSQSPPLSRDSSQFLGSESNVSVRNALVAVCWVTFFFLCHSFLPEEMRDTRNQTEYNPPTAHSMAQKRRKSSSHD